MFVVDYPGQTSGLYGGLHYGEIVAFCIDLKRDQPSYVGMPLQYLPDRDHRYTDRLDEWNDLLSSRITDVLEQKRLVEARKTLRPFG